jgi:sulfoxide reductase heme-binding subunit YedZ
MRPLGANGDQRRRLLLHHAPLALASAVVVALFMSLPLFDVHAYPHADIVSGTFPRERREGEVTGHAGGHAGRTNHDGNQNGRMRHGRDQAARHTGNHGGGDTSPRDEEADLSLSRGMQQFTVATGYVGLGLLAVTLLLGPTNLLLRRRNPVSSYLRRDVGAWTAVFSVVHVICAVVIHVSHGSGPIASFVHFFVAEDGSALTNSFGLGNWTGLGAVVIVLGLLATSSDSALRKLKARPWKWLQRLNYALFALVILHAFFYGVLLQMTSPFSLLLILSVMTVFVGQAVGVWLWRRRYWQQKEHKC